MVEDTLKGEDLYVYNLLKAHGPASAYDLMRIAEQDQGLTAEERFRICQGIHGRLSGLNGSFVEELAEKGVNPTTGKKVKIYQVTKVTGVVGKLDKDGTGYKAKYEEALQQIKELMKEKESQKEFFLLRIEKKDQEIERLIKALAA